MAIIDVVKYEQQEGIIVHKYPSCDLRWGTQLVVYPGHGETTTLEKEISSNPYLVSAKY